MIGDVARLEDDIAAMMRRFQADSEAVTLQMANFAHEFRNPLNVIVGYSELLRDTPDLESADKRHRDYCNAIHDAAQLLLGVATTVIDTSSAAASMPPAVMERVDASQVIDEMIRMLGEEARKKKISLLGNYAPNFPLIDADKIKFQQILMNLISNAIKFTRPGGRVTISTEISDNGEN
ncbi:MAG: HAMP domain-containing sensor histidine kinase, partial [Rhodospirillales bacterium]